MQTSVKKALLRKFLLNQCRKQNRNPVPSQELSLTITIPPTVQPQPKQIEMQKGAFGDSYVPPVMPL